jgi:hypothetical protein
MKRYLFLLVVVLTGCVPLAYHGKTYHLVLGVGVFHVEQSNQVTVVTAKTFGLYAGDSRLNLGLASIYSARVPTNVNVLLEINTAKPKPSFSLIEGLPP